MASLAGYKSASSAAVSLANIKKKLNLITNATAQGNPGRATSKGKGKAEADDEDEVTPAIIVNLRKRGRKPKSEVDEDGMEVAGSAPAPKKRATEGDVIGLENVSKPKKRGRKPKDEKFYSENETASDRDSTSIVKQEVADHDNHTFTAPINSNDVEATGTSQAQSSTDEEPFEVFFNMDRTI